jgi:hypothetical protein
MLSQFSAMVNDATSVSVHFLAGAVAVTGKPLQEIGEVLGVSHIMV